MSEEQLIELLLDGSPEAAAELEALRTDPATAAQLSELQTFFATCRAEFAPEPGLAADRALAERVLARTTRQDLSWHGELRLVRSFVNDRLGASTVLKLVAASLLLHVLALPVVAWVLLTSDPEDGFFIRFEDRPDPVAEEVAEPMIVLPDERATIEDLLGDPIPAGDEEE